MLDLNNLFDERFYLSQNPDVAAAVGQGVFTSGFNHFQTLGQFEKRNPSGLFTEDYYLANNPDVSQAVANRGFNTGLDHFLLYGQFENRISSVFFAPQFYLAYYSDVNQAVTNGQITPIEHFAKYGQYEKRDPVLEFYTEDYLAANPDVAQAVEATAPTADPLTAIQHFVDYGQYEGRKFGPDFDPQYYLSQYADVAAAVKPGGLSPIKHYLQFGKNEGRFGIPFTSTSTSVDLTQAVDLGTIGSASVNDFVGNSNTLDVYRFNVNNPDTVNITLNNLSADADLLLIQDQNGNGILDENAESSEVINFSNTEGVIGEQISQLLQPGSYLVAIQQFEGETNYNLSLSATPFTPPPDTAGNTLSAARNLGPISDAQTVSEFVGNSDPDDFYTINLSTNSIFNVSVDNLSADADLYVIQDSNGNGSVENEEVVAASEFADNTPEQIANLALNAGNYFVRVQQFEGDTPYNLNLSATPANIPLDNAGNTPGTARDIGILSNTQTFSDFVGNVDVDDYYRFSTNGTTDFSLTLNGLSADADVFLVLDENNNNVIDENEEFQISANEGTSPEEINVVGLPAGTYFAHVYQFNGDTNYNLALSATSSNSPPITIDDPVIPPTPPTPPTPPPPPPPTPPTPDTGERDPNVDEPRQPDEPPDPNGDKDPVIDNTVKRGKEEAVDVSKPPNDVPLAALIIGKKWNIAAGGKLSFSFVTPNTASTYQGQETGIEPVSEAVKNNVRDILKNVYEPVIPIRFVEVNEDEGNIGSLRFMYSKGSGSDFYAYAYEPGIGDVHLNRQNATDDNNFENPPGSHGYLSLIHEIGHAMGLNHPGDYNGSSTGNQGEGPFLPFQDDNHVNSVMTYNFTKNSPTTLMRYDIRALQSFYGANTSYNSGDTIYRIDSNRLQEYKTIWDGGGNDTLDFSALPADTNGYRFDLNPGGRNTAWSAYDNVTYRATGDNSRKDYQADRYAVPIAYGTIVENLVGTQSFDYIVGNNVANSINAGAGNDQIFGGGGADVITGGSGADQFSLASGSGASTIETAPTIADFNTGEGDSITLFNGLNFASVSITQGTGQFANFAVISKNDTQEILAKLSNVQAIALTQDKFKIV